MKIVRAPATSKLCPVNAKGAQQLRSGDFVFNVSNDIFLTNRAGNRTVDSGSTSVVSQTATRTAQAGISGFVDPQSTYWATGGAGASAPSFEWSAAGSRDDVDITVKQIKGPGDAMVFGPESEGTGLADGDTGTLAAGETGTLTFAFNKLGKYELELIAGSAKYKMKFAVGDTIDTGRSLVTSSILQTCAGSSVQQNLVNPPADSPDDTVVSPDNNTLDQAKGQLGDEWWTISIVGIILAAILIGFIVMVVLNSRRY